MIKVIKQNREDTLFPKRIQCEYCGSTLEIERDDVVTKQLGIPFVLCPVCNQYTAADIEELYKNLTKDNIEFPNDFHDFHNGVDVTPKDIREFIDRAIRWFRDNPDAFVYETGTGNCRVSVFNYSGDEEYEVNVEKGYWSTNIPYEAEDYRAVESVDYRWRNCGIVDRKQMSEETNDKNRKHTGV